MVRFLRAMAAGLSAFGAVNRGEEEFRIVEDYQELGAGAFADVLSAPNPWLTEDQAHVLYRVLRALVDGYSVVVAHSPAHIFLQGRDIMTASLCLLAGEDQSREQVDQGLLFELSRLAHHLFSEDTEPEEMFATDPELTYFRDKLDLQMTQEVQAFMDASFTGDLERAVKVGHVICARGVTLFKGPDTERQVEESNMRRVFAGVLLVEMAGTLCAQITPDLVKDLDDRPIGGKVSDPMEGWGSDD